MTTIKMLRDDEGVRSLHAQNTTPETTEDVDIVRPYPTIEPSIVAGRLPVREKLARARRQHRPRGRDRRSGQDRRRRNKRVLLDTRSHQERRTRNRRRGDRTAGSAANRRPQRGVDRYA